MNTLSRPAQLGCQVVLQSGVRRGSEDRNALRRCERCCWQRRTGAQERRMSRPRERFDTVTQQCDLAIVLTQIGRTMDLFPPVISPPSHRAGEVSRPDPRNNVTLEEKVKETLCLPNRTR